MFFEKYRRDIKLDHLCRQQFIREQDDITCYDRVEPRQHTDSSGSHRDYVVRMGIHSDDMLVTNIPEMTWDCQRNGEIWCEWMICARRDTPLYIQQVRLQGYMINENFHEIEVCIPMSKHSVELVLAYSKERMVMHKLTSETML